MAADDRKSRLEGEVLPVDWEIGRREGRTRCPDGGNWGIGAGVEMKYHEQGNFGWDKVAVVGRGIGRGKVRIWGLAGDCQRWGGGSMEVVAIM